MPRKSKQENALDNYMEALACRDDDHRQQYRHYAFMFIHFAGDREWDRALVLKYMDKCRRENYADGTIAHIWSVTRRVFVTNKVEWPFRKGDGPIIRDSEVHDPALHPSLVQKAIETAKAGKLTHAEAAFLALSTTYGHRRAELASTRTGDINYERRMILVKTVKKERERWHILPDEITPYLRAYPFPTISENQVSALWLSLEAKAEIPHMYDVGWHAVRRQLVKEVSLYCSELTTGNFVRHAVLTTTGRYARSKTVGGPEGTEITMDRGDTRIDELVFEQHPFLWMWR